MMDDGEDAECGKNIPLRQRSKVIPVLAYRNENHASDLDTTEAASSTMPPDYAMLELNGELIAPVEFPSKDVCRSILGTEDQVELGKLELDSAKTPVMILGSHRLKGSVEKLKEPFCLMQKQYDDNDQLQAYQIIGIVREKFLFNSYPKVIMRQP